MIYAIPLALSISLGFLIIHAALKAKTPSTLLTFFLSTIIGLGASGLLTFSSFVIFNRLVPFWNTALHLAVMASLSVYLYRQRLWPVMLHLPPFQRQDGIALIILTLVTVPAILHATLYPHGGWDAWGTWNMKARFLFLGGTSWSNMFDPMLWRDQINYPFLLPLINVWFWSFSGTPTYAVPMAMTCLITFLTAGLLFGILKEITGKWHLILVPACLFTSWNIVVQASSQYSDLLVGTFLLTSLGLLTLFYTNRNNGYLLLAGGALGMMGFTKVEGMSLLIIIGLGLTILVATRTWRHIPPKAMAIFWASTALASIPLLIFLLIYAPREVVVFRNGILSPDHPVTMERITAVLSYAGNALIDTRWHGLWLITGAAIIAAGKKAFDKKMVIFPSVLGPYIIICLIMYCINTHYEIAWWLNTSFDRVFMAMLPSSMCWAAWALHHSLETPASPPAK